MRNKYTYIITFLWSLLYLSGCISDPDMPEDIRNAKEPEVKTGSITGKEVTSITISGEVVVENGAKVTERGFFWSKERPVTSQSSGKVVAGDGKGPFEAIAEGLEEKTTYYIVAYARNIVGIAYGEELEFTTHLGKAEVKTRANEICYAESAICEGEMTYSGYGDIQKMGIYYALSKADLQSAETRKEAVGAMTTETNVFRSELTGLQSSTIYFYQAFVENDYGISVGTTESFQTTSGLPVVSSVVIDENEIGFSDALVKATLESSGEAEVTRRGFCYSSENKLPNIDDLIEDITNPEAPFEVVLTDLEAKTYYVRAFAENKFGISYSKDSTELNPKSRFPTVSLFEVTLGGRDSVHIAGTILNEGMGGFTSGGVCWSTKPQPQLGENNWHEFTNMVGEFTGTFLASEYGLKPGTTYYFSSYGTNEAGTGYGEDLTITTPEVITPLSTQYMGSTSVLPTASYFSLDNGKTCYILGSSLTTTDGPKPHFWMYDNTNYWQNMENSSPFPVVMNKTTTVPIGPNCVAFGGILIDDTVSNEVYSFNALEWHYNNVSGLRPNPTYDAVGASPTIDGKQTLAYIVGGIQAVGSTRVVSNEVWIYDLPAQSWRKGPTFPFAQFEGICVAIGDKIYAGLGQLQAHVENYTQELWSLDITDPNAGWVAEESCPGRHIVAGVALNGRIYVVNNNGIFYEYNPTPAIGEKHWKTKSTLEDRYIPVYAMYAIDNSEIYLGFGKSNHGFYSYNPYWDF